MKAIKKGLFIVVFIISLFIINNKVFAFATDYILTEEDVYYVASKYNIDLELNPNILCYMPDGRMECYFFNDDVLNNTVVSKTYSGYLIENKIDLSLTGYKFKSLDSIQPYINVKLYMNIYGTIPVFTNIDTIYDSFTYDKIYKLNISNNEEPEEVPELEINIKATNLLDFMIDKTKNIYEVLINNEIFKFILSIPLIYLCFIVLSRIIKK